MQAAQKRKRATEEPYNLASKLLERQLGGGSAFAARQARQKDAAETFRNMQLQVSFVKPSSGSSDAAEGGRTVVHCTSLRRTRRQVQ